MEVPVLNPRDWLLYNISVQTYNASGKIPLAQFCNGFSVKNTGNMICVVNGDPLQPGEAKNVGGNYGEIYRGRLDIKFQAQTVQPTPIARVCIVTQKFYMVGPKFDQRL